jgi:ribosome-binding protein aMBF1 (putative translation factor)
MTPDRFRTCLDAIGWSGRWLAAMLQVDERQVRRWASGQYAIPDNIGDWLETLADVHERNPPPVKPMLSRPPTSRVIVVT